MVSTWTRDAAYSDSLRKVDYFDYLMESQQGESCQLLGTID